MYWLSIIKHIPKSQSYLNVMFELEIIFKSPTFTLSKQTMDFLERLKPVKNSNVTLQCYHYRMLNFVEGIIDPEFDEVKSELFDKSQDNKVVSLHAIQQRYFTSCYITNVVSLRAISTFIAFIFKPNYKHPRRFWTYFNKHYCLCEQEATAVFDTCQSSRYVENSCPKSYKCSSMSCPQQNRAVLYWPSPFPKIGWAKMGIITLSGCPYTTVRRPPSWK